jgi:hypothetical protein
MVALNDVVSYIETTAASNSLLNGKVKFTFEENPVPAFKDYGIHVYCGFNPMKEETPHKLGPWLKETWFLNMDMIIDRAFAARESLSDAKGVSYWENTLKSLYKHSTNNGTFRDSFWETLFIVPTDGAQIIRGRFVCEVENRFT